VVDLFGGLWLVPFATLEDELDEDAVELMNLHARLRPAKPGRRGGPQVGILPPGAL